MIKRDGRGHSYCAARGEILGPAQDGRKRKHLPRMFSLIKNESRSSDHKRCQLAIRRRYSHDPPGSVRETKVFGFRGEYGCKAG
uniref:Uncharacterized protein n=1 Tax=Oncorhynchus tshawytscha TaxID=74940 RepID=A0AAZ3P9Q6_ONCTS